MLSKIKTQWDALLILATKRYKTFDQQTENIKSFALMFLCPARFHVVSPQTLQSNIHMTLKLTVWQNMWSWAHKFYRGWTDICILYPDSYRICYGTWCQVRYMICYAIWSDLWGHEPRHGQDIEDVVIDDDNVIVSKNTCFNRPSHFGAWFGQMWCHFLLANVCIEYTAVKSCGIFPLKASATPVIRGTIVL